MFSFHTCSFSNTNTLYKHKKYVKRVSELLYTHPYCVSSGKLFNNVLSITGDISASVQKCKANQTLLSHCATQTGFKVPQVANRSFTLSTCDNVQAILKSVSRLGKKSLSITARTLSRSAK